jgi:hypothetical protein
LKSGAFRTTFAPEAYTIASMALNELCHYPESLATLNCFRKQYESSYRWLEQRVKAEKGKAGLLYPLALAYIRNSGDSVPARVASEWVRSPLFLSHQRAINSILKSVRSLSTLTDQVQLAKAALRTEITQLEEALRDVRSQPPPENAPKASNLAESMAALAVSQAKERLDRLERSREMWAQALQHHRETAAQETARLAASIESHLNKTTARMFAQLIRVSDNNELVRAELLNVASQDIVFQSANPDFQKTAGKAATADGRETASGSWRVSDGLGSSEIWEDELGLTEANLQDNCAKKERYLQNRKSRK